MQNIFALILLHTIILFIPGKKENPATAAEEDQSQTHQAVKNTSDTTGTLENPNTLYILFHLPPGTPEGITGSFSQGISGR